MQDSELERGYKLAAQAAGKRRAGGEAIAGYKITVLPGGERFYGRLFAPMILGEGSVLPLKNFHQAVVEPEIAFRLSASLTGPGVTGAMALAATSAVGAALEIPDVPFKTRTERRPSPSEMVAANAFAAFVAAPREWLRGPFTGDEAFPALLWRNGTLSSRTESSATLAALAELVAWLANSLSGLGEHIEAGAIIMTGSACQPAFADGPGVFLADFQGLGITGIVLE